MQVERLVELDVPGMAGITADDLRELASTSIAGAPPARASVDGRPVGADARGPLLVVSPSLVPTERLAGLMRREGKAGFVVVDMTDLGDFTPTDDTHVPDAQLYLAHDVTRGDDLRGWAPTDAHPELVARGRTPLTIAEGVSWLLQQPETLEPGACFMCISSRKRKDAGGLDARTPALWISGGTGRDGRENKGAPKLGWCWAGNHHTWLGIASAAGRS